jgi:hypothetical protein
MQGVLDSIADSPKRAFELILRKIGLVWSAKEDGQLISIDRNGKEVSPFFAMLYQDGWFGFYAIAFIGLIGIFVADYRTGYRTQWMIPVSVMLFTLATAAIEALSRLRIQLVLPLMVSGGYALAYVSGMLKVHPFVFTNWRRLLFAVGGTILLMSTLYLFETTLPRPRYFSGSQLPAEVIPQDATFDGAIHLIGYQPIAHNIHQDGGVIAGRLYFERVGAVKHDYTVSVIAILPDGKVTQGEDWRLGHTGYPRLDADEWTLGKGLRDEFFIELPSFTSLPAVIKLGVILYSEEAGRAEATGNAVILGGNTVLLRQIGIIVEQVKRQPLPQNTPLPNKVTLPVRFGDSIELTDYALDKLSVQHGESVTISIDWQAVRPVSGDYNVYIHLYDDSSATIYGQGDGIPTHLGIELPTSFWSVGVPIYDRYTLRVNPDTPPGTYPIKLGFYNLLDGVRLPVDSTGGDGLVIAELEVR